jgi:hypothetical protein
VARVLRELTAPYLSPRVFSYIPGRSSWQAVAELARYLRDHRAANRDPRARGLFVVKRDISAYGDSIPLGDGSALWRLLEDAAANGAGVPRAHPAWSLVEQLLRREILVDGESPAGLTRGVPTGSAVQPVINNLYLTSLDRALEAIPGSFYVRYGDDFIFLNPRPAVTEEAAGIIDEQVATLGLEIKQPKRINCYFTGPGCPAPDWPAYRPTSMLEHLGCRLSFRGTIGLKAAKARELLIDLRTRIGSTLRLLAGSPLDERAGAVCGVVNRMLDPEQPLAQRSAMLLRYVVNDRAQLGELDYQIALELAQALSGVQGVKAFRTVAYRALRRRHGLGSLVVARNQLRQARRDRAR